MRWGAGTTKAVTGLLATLAFVAGCVYPPPPPGEPVPSLAIAVEGSGTLAGTVVVRVEAADFEPEEVRLFVDTLNETPAAVDTTSPFELVLDTTGLADGPHRLFVVGQDGRYVVTELREVDVANLSYDWTDVDAAMAAKLASVPVPGDALLVAHHGDVVYEKAFGTYTDTTVVPIASASKWLSAATIMTVVEDGLLDLDEPISSYLPVFTGDKASITLRQLLSFTSGLEEDPSCAGRANTTLQGCATTIAGLPLRAAPGAQFRYGSGHLIVAAAMAESVTGTSFTTLFWQRIAQPVGMTSSFFAGGANPNPAGGGRSNLHDYARFVRAMWNHGQIDDVQVLSRESVAEMQRDQTGGAPIVVASSIRKALGSRYGFGEWYDVLDASSGAYEVSSPGTFGFHPWIDRLRDTYGVFVVYSTGSGSNAGGWDVKELTRRAVDAAS